MDIAMIETASKQMRSIEYECMECGKVVNGGDIVDGSEIKYACWLLDHMCQRCGVGRLLDVMDPHGMYDHRVDGWKESYGIEASNFVYQQQRDEVPREITMLQMLERKAPLTKDVEAKRCDACGIHSVHVRAEHDNMGVHVLDLCDDRKECLAR